jgi:hypothetical protein
LDWFLSDRQRFRCSLQSSSRRTARIAGSRIGSWPGAIGGVARQLHVVEALNGRSLGMKSVTK